MPITNTQEVYEIRSISPVHINPSIMEGTQQLTSILGPNRGIEIVRYEPVFLVNALLTGDPGIPSWLECSPGVVDASPQAFREYAWYADDELITGATSNRFRTSNAYDGMVIKCIVRAFNILGEAFSESNGILVSVIEPIFLQEYDTYINTGMGVEDVQTVLNFSLLPITGLSVPDNITTFNFSVFPITAMATLDTLQVNYFDTYTVNILTEIRDFSITNSGAESGSSTGWTVVAGSFNSVVGPAKAGSRYFKSATSNVLCQITRIIPITNSGDLAEVAAGNGYARVGFWANNGTNSSVGDQMRVFIEALDASDDVVGTLDQFGWVGPGAKGSSNYWQQFNAIPELLPDTTTQLRIVIEFEAISRDTGNHCQIDEISLQLFKG